MSDRFDEMAGQLVHARALHNLPLGSVLADDIAAFGRAVHDEAREAAACDAEQWPDAFYGKGGCSENTRAIAQKVAKFIRIKTGAQDT